MGIKKILLWVGITGSIGLLFGIWFNILYTGGQNNNTSETNPKNDSVNVNNNSNETNSAATNRYPGSTKESRQNKPKNNTTLAAKGKPAVSPNPAAANIQNAERDFYSPKNLDRLIGNTPLSTALSIAHGLPDETIQEILNKIPEDYLKEKLATAELGFSNEELKDNNPLELINSLLKVSETGAVTDTAEVFFTSLVNPNDNSPGYATPYFYENTKKIFACFKNEGTMADFKEVVSLWKNTSTGKVTYWGKQMINPWSKWNYVWLEYKSNWPKGSYIVSFYKNASSSKCLAQGRFEVK
ncbi:MAG: hypothetical protein HY811_01480 [Planctomycetes bacterium]|nr:hypothetical protein [Planctomycetota bacterium]